MTGKIGSRFQLCQELFGVVPEKKIQVEIIKALGNTACVSYKTPLNGRFCFGLVFGCFSLFAFWLLNNLNKYL